MTFFSLDSPVKDMLVGVRLSLASEGATSGAEMVMKRTFFSASVALERWAQRTESC